MSKRVYNLRSAAAVAPTLEHLGLDDSSDDSKQISEFAVSNDEGELIIYFLSVFLVHTYNVLRIPQNKWLLYHYCYF